jgi:hypothetical protein
MSAVGAARALARAARCSGLRSRYPARVVHPRRARLPWERPEHAASTAGAARRAGGAGPAAR